MGSTAAPSHRDSTPRKPRFHLSKPDEIRSYPEPTWLIEDVIVDRSFVLLYGPSNVGKSFVGLDMALCIATGRGWHGRPVQQGPVVYVFGEGKAGLSKRFNAWEKAHGPVTDFYAVDVAAQLHDPKDLEALFAVIQSADVRPTLCVFDTLARSSAGQDENSPKDMGLVVDGVTRIITEFDVTVLLIHHTGRKGANPRGHSVLDGATDTMLLCRKTGTNTLTLQCIKQKDAEFFEDIGFRREKVENSCIVVAADVASANPSRAQTALEALVGIGARADHKDWHAAWHKATGQAASTFSKAKKDLLRDGQVVLDKDETTYVVSTPTTETTPEMGAHPFPFPHPPLGVGKESGEKRNGADKR